MARTGSSRRRQRSVRLGTSVGLMAAASVAVLVTLPVAGSPLFAGAAVLALLCSWAAVRITQAEVVQSRRAHARDGAAQGRAFRLLLTARSQGQAAFAAAMTERLTSRDRQVGELQATLRVSERRAADADDRAR